MQISRRRRKILELINEKGPLSYKEILDKTSELGDPVEILCDLDTLVFFRFLQHTGGWKAELMKLELRQISRKQMMDDPSRIISRLRELDHEVPPWYGKLAILAVLENHPINLKEINESLRRQYPHVRWLDQLVQASLRILESTGYVSRTWNGEKYTIAPKGEELLSKSPFQQYSDLKNLRDQYSYELRTETILNLVRDHDKSGISSGEITRYLQSRYGMRGNKRKAVKSTLENMVYSGLLKILGGTEKKGGHIYQLSPAYRPSSVVEEGSEIMDDYPVENISKMVSNQESNQIQFFLKQTNTHIALEIIIEMGYISSEAELRKLFNQRGYGRSLKGIRGMISRLRRCGLIDKKEIRPTEMAGLIPRMAEKKNSPDNVTVNLSLQLLDYLSERGLSIKQSIMAFGQGNPTNIEVQKYLRTHTALGVDEYSNVPAMKNFLRFMGILEDIGNRKVELTPLGSQVFNHLSKVDNQPIVADMSVEHIFTQLEGKISKEEFGKKIREKIGEFGGLLSEEGAALIVAADLRVNLRLKEPFRLLDIKSLDIDMHDIYLCAKVTCICETKEFQRDSGAGRVANVEVIDNTGSARIVLWDDLTGFTLGLNKGDIVEVWGGFVKKGFREGVEIHLTPSRKDVIIKISETDKDLPEYKIEHTPIGELKEEMTDVDVVGRVGQLYGIREFQYDKSTNKVALLSLVDNTGEIRLYLWNDKADISTQVERGDTIAVENGYTRMGLNGLELHSGWRGRIIINPFVETAGSDPDYLEYKARSLVAAQCYSKARSSLEQVIELAPERKKTLQNEFGFLYDFAFPPLKNEEWQDENSGLIEWRQRLWYILSDRNSFLLQKVEGSHRDEAEDIPEESLENEYVESDDTSKGKGDTLEEAVMELFHQFFIIADEDEKAILQELRQQKKGIQFGHDISFECTVKGNENVKCHIECKNRKSDITPKDIADKLESTEIFYPDIDHWILISPHSNPSNQLKLFLNSWKKKGRYSFDVQVWCPETDVKEFFGLSPSIYELFYKSRGDEIHPSEWTKEKRHEVFEKWKEKLKSVIRLPKEWDKYIRDDSRMFINGDRTTVLKSVYRHYVPLRCMDEKRNIISQTLEQYILEWLKDTNTPIMFLLGDFGDGKTAFTYILSRNLANEFLKDPSTGWIPVRFALRDYSFAEGARGFLRRRLEEFRADIASWKEVISRYNLLVILDGFDEMTRRLDSRTVTQNIKDLIECCKEFEGSKILITSRKHFFENQKNVKRLLQRLPPNRTCYLVPIDRHTTIEHLEEYAAKLGEEKKLKNIYKLHDPIGLASKPLFLQMVKETLDELPEENLDEATLYETYIEKSLIRKIEYLDDAALKITPKDAYSNLIEILEEIALRLQGSKEDYVLLEEFVGTDNQNLAELLWKMSESDEIIDELVREKKKAVEDATARVGVRSLLTRIKTDNETHKWPVDFCHRSMREYFMAKGICRTLCEDLRRARELFVELPLNYEILYFGAELMKQDNTKEYEKNLLNLIKSTKSTNKCGALGGNAVTILFRLKGELPGDNWSGLNLDYADLSGANLSNKNFSGTSLRYANLDNVNFEGADFRNCDLTGVQIEETAPVLAVTANCFGDRVIAAYGDNTIREWNISQRMKNEWKVIGRNTNGFIIWIGISPDTGLCALTNEEVIFYDYRDQGEFLERARFRMKSEYRQVLTKENDLLLISEKENESNKILLIDLQQKKIRELLELEKVDLCENLDGKTFVLFLGGTSLRIVETNNSSLETAITLPAREVTSLCVFNCRKNAEYLLACGQRNGEVFVWQIDLSEEKLQGRLLLERHDHDGPVSSLVFLDESRIVSGSVDRKIFIVRLERGTEGTRGIKEDVLHLTARCKGMKIKGVKGERERKMLENLIFKA